MKVSFKQRLLTSAIDELLHELALMDLNEIRNVGPRVLLKGFVYEAIKSWFCTPAGFAWLGDGRKPQGALSDPARREEET